ncbi:transcription factor BIM1-like [Pyrus ussuriensis x Pyrus communis]|uniref:Transcription factor BIM1-like n=1 Tax=Pyrus ussuriensis x Pyrus communis TaxID=2448454 RepID=A0A5N5IE50_9ROSA|nr:transcription factor BIM1-like [Pyrus ussuriensis x Pyrus communis]
MELPQPRPFGTEGRKPTHDFLSLHAHSVAQQDPRPPTQGRYLETHDFLRPLERMGKPCIAKEETSVEISTAEKQPSHAAAQPTTSVEHILPGGIGTYSISHISYFNQRVPKPEGSPVFTVAQTSSNERNVDENSNCSSYTGSGFTLWEESAKNKGKTGKENVVGERPLGTVRGQWTSSERPAQSSSNNHRSCFSSQSSGQKNMSFMEMMKYAAKGSAQEAELDNEEEFVLKKETSTTTTNATTTYKSDLRVNVDVKSSDQKANTPRSKHSATEQRRRSKINDRFQMLRELIPHSDQKRDKASFLLEVIEYIQFLQERVNKYEGPYQGWNHDPAKLMPWINDHKLRESYCDQSRGMNGVSGPALPFAAKFDEKPTSVLPTIPGSCAQNPVESDTSTETTFKAVDHHPGITSKSMPFPLSMQPNFFAPVRSSAAAAVPPIPPRLPSDAENTSQHRSMLCQTRSCAPDGTATRDKLKEQELTIEGGRINISSAYSQGILNTLTQALQSSGVDLSQASISVKIELGKRANRRSPIPKSAIKENEIPTSTLGKKHSLIASSEESEQAQKKLKTFRN